MSVSFPSYIKEVEGINNTIQGENEKLGNRTHRVNGNYFISRPDRLLWDSGRRRLEADGHV